MHIIYYIELYLLFELFIVDFAAKKIACWDLVGRPSMIFIY